MFRERMGNRFPASNMALRKVDVGDESQVPRFVDEVVKQFGKLDILVNLVGGFWGGKSIAETTMAEWQAMFDLNLKPTFICCKAVLPVIQKNKNVRVGLVSP